ncbi:MAG: OmpA family protein, partial [Acidobacteriota bacterium]
MAKLLGAPIGKPSADETKSGVTSCIYPPGDAGSWAQAAVAIEWEHGSAASFERQLVDAFGGSAVGRKVAHHVDLGDDASYSREGVLSIRQGDALVTITLPMRTDSEEKATAIGRRIVEQLPHEADADKAPAKEEGIVSALGALFGEAIKEKADNDKKENEPPALPEGFVPNSECGDVPAAATPDVGTPGEAGSVPLIEGLTLSMTWIPKADDYEHECLEQVTKIDPRQIWVTRSCPVNADRHLQIDHRQVCRTDFANARIFAPVTSQETPFILGGTTFFSLSQISFRELNQLGETPHRYLHFKNSELRADLAGTLKRGNRSTYRIIVNDRSVDLPVREVTGTIGKALDVHPRGIVLDDERFPLVLDYGWEGYSIRFTKISYPAASQLETQLDKERRVDVYGIYFDFASDRIRSESEPILKEIGAVMLKNPEWTLSINGHTDNIGGDKFNLDLSRRRSEAVRKALNERYKIDPARLSTSGSGASQPNETNDTIEGRAKNRRV